MGLPRNIVLLFFCFARIIGFSQSSAIIGNSSENEFSYAICADNLGYSYLGGFAGNNGLITKTDLNNNIIWSKSFQFSSNSAHKSVITCIDQIGDTIFGCGWIESSTAMIGSLYFKINATTGNPYWLKSENTSGLYFSSCKYSNGKYFLVGSQNQNGKVVCVSSTNGNQIWATDAMALMFQPNINYVDDFLGATEMINGKMFITGRSFIDGASSLDMRPVLIGITDQGTIFLQKYLLFNENDPGIDRFYGMAIDYQGTNSVVVSFFGDDDYVGVSDYQVGITKLDLFGNVLFTKYYNIAGVNNEIVKSLNITQDSYVLFGYVNHGSANTKLFALETDTNGVYQNAKLYSTSNGNFNTLTGPLNICGESDYVNDQHFFCASHHNGNLNLRDNVKIHLDQNLNILNTCFLQENVSVATQIFTPFSGSISIQNFTPTFTPNISVVTTNYGITNPCGSFSITFDSVPGCDTTWVTAIPAGFTNPTYYWSNGATTNTAFVTNSETLTVEISEPQFCCELIDSVELILTNQIVEVNLPPDTTLCMQTGSFLILTPTTIGANGSETYLWNTGETTSSIFIDSTGWYSVTMSTNCGLDTDSIYVTVNQFLESYTILDTTICNYSYPINFTLPYLSYDSIIWNNGNSGNLCIVASPGNYYFTAFNSCGSVTDTFNVSSAQTLNLNEISDIDTCLIEGEVVSLNAIDYTSENIIWSTGQTTGIVDFIQSGSYYLIALNSCYADTSFFNLSINYFPYLNLPSSIDTCLVQGEILFFNAFTVSGSYSWNIGSSESVVQIDTSGMYICSLTNMCGTVQDTLLVNNISDADLILEPGIQYFCADEISLSDLSMISLGNVYFGTEPFINNLIDIDESGIYYITAYDDCGSVSQPIEIIIENTADFYAPNSFTPNGDEFNNMYEIKGENFAIVDIQIYNRWGQIVYEEIGGFTGWDGTLEGHMCQDGLYVVVVNYTDCLGINIREVLHVNLLK